MVTNCSNNYGPWQFPEKLIPLYGDGQNVRDWLYLDDHADALSLAATQGQLGRSYCVGGHGERTNKQVVEAICSLLDQLQPAGAPHRRLITPVTDRPGHDRRYAIDPKGSAASSVAASPQLRGWSGGHRALVCGASGLVPPSARAGRLQRRPTGGAGGGGLILPITLC